MSELSESQYHLRSGTLPDEELKRELDHSNEIKMTLECLETSSSLPRNSSQSPQILEPMHVTQVQEQLLDERTVLLEYACFGDCTFLWVISKTAFNTYCLPGRDDLRQLVLELGLTIRGKGGDYSKAADALYRAIIEPASGFLEKVFGVLDTTRGVPSKGTTPGRIIVVPDHLLLFMPFEVLFGRKQSIGNYIQSCESDSGRQAPKAESVRSETPLRILTSEVSATIPREGSIQTSESRNPYSIVYAPSATMMSGLRTLGRPKGDNWDKDFIGFAPVKFRTAPSLAHTETEVKTIAQMFDEARSEIFLHDKSDLRSILATPLGRCRYIHFATHSVTNIGDPHECGLLFPDRETDSLLDTLQIVGLTLNADLVTVSACMTVWGQPIRGEGLMGLTRAFFRAGARSVCVSLWPVDDESTAAFMEKFYANLLSDEFDKADALRAAKIDMLKDLRWRHPFHWAPFVLVGDWT